MKDSSIDPPMQVPKQGNRAQNPGTAGAPMQQTQNSSSQKGSGQQQMQQPPKKHMPGWIWLVIGLIVGAGIAAAYFLVLA